MAIQWAVMHCSNGATLETGALIDNGDAEMKEQFSEDFEVAHLAPFQTQFRSVRCRKDWTDLQ